MINLIQNRKLWLVITGITMALCISFVAIFGLKFGIDFTGGNILEVKLEKSFTAKTVTESLKDMNLGDFQVKPTGENNVAIRTKEMNDETKNQIEDKLRENFGNVEEQRFDTIGPTIGKELREKSIYVSILVVAAIVVYIAYAFRKVSGTVSSWRFGVSAIIALAHDIIIVVGVYAILGKFFNVEVDTLFIVALLTVLGYSVNDTIIVFDRIRDKLLQGLSVEEAAKEGINDTIVRSLNTALTTLIMLFAILFFGGATIKYFVLALIIGIASGTYSSIFIAAQILVEWQMRARKKQR